MKPFLNEWQEKINQLNQRERVLVFLVCAALLGMLLHTLLLAPVLKEREVTKKEIAQLKAASSATRNEVVLLSAEIKAGVNRVKEQRRKQLLAQQALLDQRIEESVIAMIPPQMMTGVLEEVLAQDSELQLLGLENLPVTSIIEDDADKTKEEKKPKDKEEKVGLYKHRFVLTLRGNYLSTVRYFEKLKTLPWRFQWDSLNYEVTDYPNATIMLQVHTVSRSEDWIGV